MSVVPFEENTIKLMQEVFGGHVCCKCEAPAERFKVYDRDTETEQLVFFCGNCFHEINSNGMRWFNVDRYRTFRYRRIREVKFAE